MTKSKILKSLLLILIIGLLVFTFTGCSKINENILKTNKNGIFEYKTYSDLNSAFTLGSTESATLSSVFKMNYVEDSNLYTIDIDTASTGYAYISQFVDLDANTYYKATYDVKISNISKYSTGKDLYGVFVTFDESKNFNQGENAIIQNETFDGTQSITFKVTKAGRYNIKFCVGNEDHPVDTDVTLKSFTLEKINKADSNVNFVGELKPDNYGNYSLFNIFYIVAGSILVVILCFCIYFLYQRHLYITAKNDSETKEETDRLQKKRVFIEKLNNNNFISILILICSTLLISFITNIISIGVSSTYASQSFGYSIDSLATQGVFFAKFGPQYMIQSLSQFASDNNLAYAAISSSPLSVILVGFCGLFGRMFEGFGLQTTYLATLFFIRLLLALADVGVVIIIYKLLKAKNGNTGAMLIALLYAILPTVFSVSGFWGQMESVMVFFIALTIYFMLKNNYIPTAIFYFIACMISQTALLIAPMILFYTILKCINTIKIGKYNVLISACSILVLSFFVYYALCVPFTYNQIIDGNGFYCFTRSWNELYTNCTYTLNAFNFQMLLGNNNGTISTASLIVSIIFILFLLSLCGVAYFKYKNRMNLLLLMSAFINMMFVFGNGMKPVSMLISLSLMLLYAIMNKEKRIFFAFSMYALLMFVNVSYVELFVPYSLTAQTYMSANAMSYVFSIIYLLITLYYVYISYDIVVAKKVRQINPMPLSFSKWVINVGRKIHKGFLVILMKFQRK